MSDETFETDYLVVGAGAAGMAFADALLAYSDATLTIVDRRHAPGGHWIDAYPYVRLHQPSAFYGVSSVPLGRDVLDTAGTNAGYYELAGADEIRAYFAHVMRERFLPGGRVRYFPCSEYIGDGRFVSRFAQGAWNVRVRRKVIDTTYLEGTVPATSAPPFEVAEGVCCVPAGDIARIAERPGRFVVIGAGKTALDTCVWLLEQNVSASSICWIKPREAWWLNRRFQQPLAQLPDSYRGMAIQLEAMAQAASIEDLCARLEAAGFFLRVDRGIAPSMFRGAVISEAEVELLRKIGDVVRLGHVRRIERDEIVLDEGRVPTSEASVHIHCAARGLMRRPLCPIFEAGRVTIQPFLWGFACYQFAMLGVIEALVESDEDKNRLCPPIAYWDESVDYISAFLSTLANERARMAYPALASWAKETRLNPFGGIKQYRDAPDVIDARDRIKRYAATAASNLARLLPTNAA
ncbi:MAG TPA: NAD(P)-binding protein [Paraburkholderia sp.]|uniref:NAD(P)-binding protein n=1 Tax=Paraburkholderia sp. TaxID=1926495 RepID=UPI002B46F0AA|nr:NAD(P)-binding protein [Paraburkholderia sp.]HKR44629.1 NAD(P)-binding protein [Paraburkholderia sp.]